MVWKTTVDELFSLFVGAGTSLIPWMEKARVYWKEPDAYDDWNDIVALLYRNIVCSALYPELDEYPIVGHGYMLENYTDRDYIVVRSSEFPIATLVFVAFESNVSPFYTVIVAPLDEDGSAGKWILLSGSGLEFAHSQLIDGRREIRRDVHVLF